MADGATDSTRTTSTPTVSTATAWPGALRAITLFVEDLSVARRFYRDALGWTLVFEDADSCVFRVGGTLINLLRVEAAPELVDPMTVGAADVGPRAVITLEVDDVDAVCEVLSARGVRLLNGPMDRPWGVRTASFVAPGGHVWEIAQ